MKILWFTNNQVNLDSSSFGGGWMQSLERQLSAQPGVKLSIATRIRGKRIQRRVVNGTDYYLLPDNRNLLQKRIDLFLNREPIEYFLAQNLQLVEELKPDVIHIFGTEMDYGLIAGQTSAPVVIHIQGILKPCYYQLKNLRLPFWRHYLAQSFSDYLKGSTVGNGLRIFRRRVEIEKKIFQRCSNFIGRTDWDRSITKLFSPSAEYFHCDEMIGDVFFNDRWSGCEDHTIHIVSTISNPFYKGHDTLVATALALREAGFNFNWHVIGLDESAPAYRFFYRDTATYLKDQIRFHGKLQQKEIIEVMKGCNLYVHPSHIENSSNSICEAMALGMPVIALHVGGNASLINDGVDGILASDNDPYRLAEIIARTSHDRVLSERLGMQAALRARARHDKDAIVNRMINIYKEVISNHAA